MTEHICKDRSCATACPKCGALCHIHNSLDGGIGSPFPQPDLTKLREAYRSYVACETGVYTYSRAYVHRLVIAVKELLEQKEKP